MRFLLVDMLRTGKCACSVRLNATSTICTFNSSFKKKIVSKIFNKKGICVWGYKATRTRGYATNSGSPHPSSKFSSSEALKHKHGIASTFLGRMKGRHRGFSCLLRGCCDHVHERELWKTQDSLITTRGSCCHGWMGVKQWVKAGTGAGDSRILMLA